MPRLRPTRRPPPRAPRRWLRAEELEGREQASATGLAPAFTPVPVDTSAGSYAAILTVNAPPVVTVPAAQYTPQNKDVTFSAANGNAIVVADPDALATDLLEVTLTTDATNKIKLKTKNGLTITAGQDDKQTVTFRGTLAAIDDALDGLKLKLDSHFTGVATIAVAVNDLGNRGTGGAQTTQATARVYVGVPITPYAADDAYATTANTAVSVPADGVLANDDDPYGYGLSVAVGTAPSHGTLQLYTDGSFTYRPATNYVGTDSFTYRARSGLVYSDFATVTVTVNPLPPVANADTYSTAANTALTVAAKGVLANDTDPQGRTLTAVLVSGPAHGTLALNANGGFVYTPDANYVGSDGFTYRANDGLGNSAVTAVSLTVNALPPTAKADAYSTTANTPLTVAAAGVLANDTDPQARPLTAALVSGPSKGSLTLNADGSFSYTPNANYVGSDSFTYRANDGLGTSSPITVSLTVAARPPVATDDTYATFVGQPLTIPAAGVLANDTDPQALALSAAVATGPAHGTLTLNANGSFTYRPTAGYAGTDSFTYKATDAYGTSAPATVTISITSRPPVATADSFTTPEDTAKSGNVLANDSDPDGDPITAALRTGPAHGTLTLNASGAFTYTPDANWNGTDGFTYRVTDPFGQRATGTVTLTVTPVNDAPVAQGNTYTAVGGVPRTVYAPGILANDSDVEGDPLTAVLVTGPAHGALLLNADGSFTYTALSLYVGSDSFTYKVFDGQTYSNVATVNFTVGAAPNRPPVANDDFQTLAEDTSATNPQSFILGNDTDPDGDSITSVIQSYPTNGTLVRNPDGTYTYTPNPDFYGTDSFTYRATDGSSLSNLATVTITVTPVNDPPTLAPIADVALLEDAGPQTVALSGLTAGGGESQTLTVTATSNNPALTGTPAVSYASPGTAGTLAFTPAANASGTATITVTVSDGIATTTQAFVVTVAAVNDPPVANADTRTTNEDTPKTFDPRGNDTDVEGDPLTVVAVTQASHGSVTFTAAGVTYTPAANWNGIDSFTYTISDGHGGTSTAAVTVVVAPVNDAPIASYDAFGGSEDTTLTGDVLANDSDDDGDTLTATVVVGPRHGTLALAANGTFAYTPDADWNGTDSFTYRARDGNGGSSTASVALTVAPVNDAPTAADLSYTTAYTLRRNALADAQDVDGDPLTAELLTGAIHGTVTMAADGAFAYTPDADFQGTDSFTFRVGDGQAYSGTVTATIKVVPTVAERAKEKIAGSGLGSLPPVVVAEVSKEARERGEEKAKERTDGGSFVSAPLAEPRIFPDFFTSTNAAQPGAPNLPAAEARPAPPVAAPQVPAEPPLPAGPLPKPDTPAVAMAPVAEAAPEAPLDTLAVSSPVFQQLDQLAGEIRDDSQAQAVTDTVVVGGVVAGAGYVMLNTRVVYWFLSALLARPAVWRPFDPLEVIYAWEKEKKDADDPEAGESLQSMVGG